MKRPELARVDEPEPHEADENVRTRGDRVHRIIALTRPPEHGLVAVTRVRIRQTTGATVDVDGYGLPHALRRLALLVEQEQATGDLDAFPLTEPRRLALRTLEVVAKELWRLSNEARMSRADAASRLILHGVTLPPADLQPDRGVIDELGAAMRALRIDLAFEEG